MTENHPTGQNPPPAHTTAGLTIALCGLLTLTGEQLQHLGTAITALAGIWPLATALTRRT